MEILLDIDKIQENNIYFKDRIINNIIDGYFSNILYSTEYFVLNSINLKINLNIKQIEKKFNKYNIYYDIMENVKLINKLSYIEKCILKKYTLDKTHILLITNIFLKGNINLIKKQNKINDIILKISGIWDNGCECGLTYKILLN